MLCPSYCPSSCLSLIWMYFLSLFLPNLSLSLCLFLSLSVCVCLMSVFVFFPYQCVSMCLPVSLSLSLHLLLPPLPLSSASSRLLLTLAVSTFGETEQDQHPVKFFLCPSLPPPPPPPLCPVLFITRSPKLASLSFFLCSSDRPHLRRLSLFSPQRA